MGFSAGSSRVINKKFNKKGKNGGGGGGGITNGKRPLLEGAAGWYKVQVIKYYIMLIQG